MSTVGLPRVLTPVELKSENSEGGGGDVVFFNFPDVDATVKFPTGFFFFFSNISIITILSE